MENLDIIGGLKFFFTLIGENNGSQSFTTRSISKNLKSINKILVFDIDNDGDIDIFHHLMALQEMVNCLV
ncbi:hypothetical protein CM15mP37_05380 [bacterium]|nr:MAG: hypothetical protein CM15mP37_05380 [bacterium]